jgi:Rrf2 family protein
MLTHTGLYALQALLYLAGQTPPGAQVSAATMATDLEIPRTYLAKILQRLVREGMLESARGPRGGYRLLRDPADLSVAEAVTPFQDLRTPQICLLGGPCDLDNPCTAHARRNAWNTRMLDLMQQTTLADLLSGAPPEELAVIGDTTQENPR